MIHKEPLIEVGIMSAEKTDFFLSGSFREKFSEKIFSGKCQAVLRDKKILLTNENKTTGPCEKLYFEPVKNNQYFEIKNVTIGKEFHWEQQEHQQFSGSLKLLFAENKIYLINILPVEDYLKSVISSEMSPGCPEEFLKTHAVISRSWILSQILQKEKKQRSEFYQKKNSREIIKWYDREDHVLFDVCADDHCQRYQGMNRMKNEKILRAIESTRGKVLFFKDQICDTRYSKCCGGVTECFENVWEPVSHPYLIPVADNEPKKTETPDLRGEHAAKEWILNNPEAFCNTTDKKILSQILKNYDQAFEHFYRWKQSLTQEQAAIILKKKTGIDFGQILDIVPVERGFSGRLIRIQIKGSKKTMIFGKELEIRRILSESHLYSSAFIIEKAEIREGVPGKFMLYGAGWGHGVGLCQIGAAMMSKKGYTHLQILKHYFPGTALRKVY